MSLRRRLPAVLLVPVAVLALAACTGDGDDGDGGAAPVPTPAEVTATPQVGVSARPPVAIGEPAELSAGVAVTVAKVTAVQLTAKGPGETSGPGARVAVAVRNRSDAAVDLGQLAVTATYGKGTPASPITSDGPAPLAGQLAPGAGKTGIYLYRLPRKDLATLRVEVSSGASPYVLTFTS